MRTRTLILGGTLAVLAAAGALAGRSDADGPRHAVPESKDGSLVVALCDGETTVEVPGVEPGDTMPRAQAQSVADRLMDEWRRKNPDARWDDAPVQLAQADTGAAPRGDTGAAGGAGAPGAAAVKPADEQVQTGIYSAYTERDQKIWMAATDKFVQDGHKIFHDANAFGGTIGVSCDMCHPDASNTHPETYPKFQVQLGRVAMLRDMINWCIENPTRGKPLPDGDVRLKAMEAYIIAQRKGTPLDYGKH
jgi:hypothetical protein